MPEGHIVHADARRFTAAMVGRTVRATSPQGRFADGAARLDGRTMEAAQAYGKHLFLRFSGSGRGAVPYLHVHLGLIGAWSWWDATGAQTAGRPVATSDANVRLRLAVPGGPSADLRAVMTCTILDEQSVDKVLSTLGPDPIPLAESALQSASPTEGALQPINDGAAAGERVRRSGKAIGTLLLDQSVVAGAGLIWRCEAPFLARISPHRPGRDITTDEWTTLWHELSRIMRDAVDWGGPADAPAPTDGHRTLADTFHVFRRDGQPCRLCGTPIRVAPLDARKVWWCPHHQPHPAPQVG